MKITMTPEEEANKKIFWVLQRIRQKSLVSSGESIAIDIIDDLQNPEIKLYCDETFSILQKLSNLRAISEPFQHPDANGERDDLRNLYFFDINENKFNELYELYEKGGSYLNLTKKTDFSSQPMIKPKALELIAKEIGNLDSGSNLIEFLANCGVNRDIIEYPNTKWRMLYSVLLTLASPQNKEDRRTLFKIIEGACHPLMYDGDKILAKKTADKFNSFLEYDDFFIKDGILWQGWDDGSGALIWDDKDGNRIEPDVYLILPKKIDKLYVYWNELIKLTKFYFNNKDNQDDEINDIYFEVIANVEKLLNANGCGGLKDIYKKPFRNMIGCEFEIQKQGLTTDGLFVNLYDFLGRITELSLPDKNNVEKIKKDNSAFFAKVKQYSGQHLRKKGIIQKRPISEEVLKLSPEIYGVGINLKALFKKIWKKINKK